MKIFFIRHGEPDYSEVTTRNYVGHGIDLAGLSEDGRKQAAEVAESPLLEKCTLIISSPYTRALETAAIISRLKNLPLVVELGLHEWIADLSFRLPSEKYSEVIEKIYDKFHGEWPENSPIQYETARDLVKRGNESLEKYRNYEQVIVVSHGMLIKAFTGVETVGYCEIVEMKYP